MRKNRGLTLVDVTDLVGVSNPYLSQVETGRNAPSLGVMDELSKAYQVPLYIIIEKAGYDLGFDAPKENTELRNKLSQIKNILKE